MFINKKLGYYVCDNLEFESKIQACFHSIKVQKPIEWIFNDIEFSLYDWTKEPDQSLDDLYNKRVIQLREKYDYLILSYSGGADSHNILMSFIRQGIHLDEILINTMEKGWQPYTILDPRIKTSTNSGAEHYLQTIPRLKEIEKYVPKTKITICDLTDHVYDSLLSIGDESWVLHKREALNPIGITRFNYIYFSEIRKKFDREKRIGLILGVEKPKSLIEDNKFYIRFNDRSANMITIIDHIKEYDNSTVEYFYWSPDCVPLLIKQGHVIRRWLRNNINYRQYWDSRIADYSTNRLYHERLLRKVMYPSTWNDSWYQAHKAVKDWYSEFDEWFIADKSSKANIIWRNGLKFVTDKLNPFVRFDSLTNQPDGLQPYVKKYYIGDVEPN